MDKELKELSCAFKRRKYNLSTHSRTENLTKGLLDGTRPESQFVIKIVQGKGRGVFLKAPLLAKDFFVLEYEGDLISADEATARDRIYAHNGEGCFILYFTFKGDKLAIDATRRYDSYARFINHSGKPNIRFHRPLVTDLTTGLPRVAAYALRDIRRGEELVMDYGIKNLSSSSLRSSQVDCTSDGDSDCLGSGDSVASSDTESDCQMSLTNYPAIVGLTSCLESNCSICGTKNVEFPSFRTLFAPVGPTKGTSNNVIFLGEFAVKLQKVEQTRFKKAYFGAYKSFGSPKSIARIPDDMTKKDEQKFKEMISEQTKIIAKGPRYRRHASPVQHLDLAVTRVSTVQKVDVAVRHRSSDNMSCTDSFLQFTHHISSEVPKCVLPTVALADSFRRNSDKRSCFYISDFIFPGKSC